MVDEGACSDATQRAPEQEAHHVVEAADERDALMSKKAPVPGQSTDIPVQQIVPLMQVRLCNTHTHESPHAPGVTDGVPDAARRRVASRDAPRPPAADEEGGCGEMSGRQSFNPLSGRPAEERTRGRHSAGASTTPLCGRSASIPIDCATSVGSREIAKSQTAKVSRVLL